MPLNKLRLFPDPILRKTSLFVRDFDANLSQTVIIMTRIMKSQPSGIGIAAPQLGLSKRIAIVDVSPRVKSAGLMVLINPEILEYQGEILSREGCMSLPEYTADVKRFNRIRLRWNDLRGATYEKWCEGIEARCIQHEIDHLNGLLFLDRVASLRTDMIPRKSRKPKRV